NRSLTGEKRYSVESGDPNEAETVYRSYGTVFGTKRTMARLRVSVRGLPFLSDGTIVTALTASILRRATRVLAWTGNASRTTWVVPSLNRACTSNVPSCTRR